MDSTTTILDKVFVYLFAIVYILISLTSRYSSYLGKKVSLGSMKAALFSSSFILCWMWDSHYFSGCLYYILMLAAAVDFGKHLYFFGANLKKWKASRSAIFGVALSVFAGGLKFIPSIWINLLPSLVYVVPLLQKIIKRKYGFQEYLTRFEISNWTCMSLWMCYAYLNPHNYYFFEPRPLLVSIFIGLLEIQLFISLALQITQRADNKPLLQYQETKCELSLEELNFGDISDYEQEKQKEKNIL